jgi:peroxiredoxin
MIYLMVAAVIAMGAVRVYAELIPGKSIGTLKAITADGKQIDLGNYGRPYVLFFFIPNDKKNGEQIAALAKFLNKKVFSRFGTVAVTRGKGSTEQQQALNFLKSKGLKAKVIFDPKFQIAEKFQIVGQGDIPGFFIVDEKGILKTLHINSVTAPVRKRGFDEFLSLILKGGQIPYVDMIPLGSNTEVSAALIGKKAPDFTVYDLKTNKYTLSSFKGKNLILVYWWIRCPHCLAELPKLQNFYLGNRERYNFEILAITNVGNNEEKTTMNDIVRSKMLAFPAATDPEGIVAKEYGVSSVPAIFFIDKDGKIVEYLSGESPDFGQTYNSIFRDPLRFGPGR